MNKEKLSIINVKVVSNEKIIIEFIYKHDKCKDVSILLNNDNDCIEMFCQTTNFSKELDITRANIFIKPIKPCTLKIKIKVDNEVRDTIILDNKEQEITSPDNQYIIFMRKYKLKILNDKIVIENRKKLDKLQNEIKKQIYSFRKYKKIYPIRLLSRRKKKYYLFNDRIMYGDDNAEELFKYINKNDKTMAKDCYFVLDKKSNKINKIKRYGKVLKYGSWKHKVKYLNARMVISSHASYFDRVYNPFDEKEMDILKDLVTKKFIFLQHGVTYNDVHNILNRPQITADLFITTTQKEYKTILSEQYMYDKEMVVCTGLARFDKLENNSSNIILIAPTWRTYLTDAKYGTSNKQKFEESKFYQEYQKILEDEKLRTKLKELKYRIYFLLHPAFSQFQDIFKKYNSDIVKILTTENISYSELFKQCSIFITDYSSTHFDVAFMKKPIIYYQFDKEEFYTSHYNQGDFDYESEGFGSVSYDEETLIEQLFSYLENNCKIKEEYEKRIVKTFRYLDRNNSKRIYNEIKKLDEKDEVNYRFNNVH